jgi:thymidylate synthase (FAD)
VARELARVGLGLNTYTQWYWKVDLHNLLWFLRLRADLHAQYEIRACADVILKIVADWVPLTHGAFLEHQINGYALSASAVELLRRAIPGDPIAFDKSGLSRREWDELDAVLGLSTRETASSYVCWCSPRMHRA